MTIEALYFGISGPKTRCSHRGSNPETLQYETVMLQYTMEEPKTQGYLSSNEVSNYETAYKQMMCNNRLKKIKHIFFSQNNKS